MKTIKEKIFLLILAIYGAIFWVFLGRTFLEIAKQPYLSDKFTIPQLSLDQLNSVIIKLGKRTNLEYPEKIDLSKVNFGKIEPFNP